MKRHKSNGNGWCSKGKPTGATPNFQTREQSKPEVCVYCKSAKLRAIDCDKVKTVDERKKLLAKNCLIFNCSRGQERAADCRSGLCRKCQRKHHSSICAKKDDLHKLKIKPVKRDGI